MVSRMFLPEIQRQLLTCFEELAGRREDDLVGGHRALLAGQSHVEEVLLLPKLSELPAEVRVVIFPGEAKFLILHLQLKNCSILKKYEREMTSVSIDDVNCEKENVAGGSARSGQSPWPG